MLRESVPGRTTEGSSSCKRSDERRYLECGGNDAAFHVSDNVAGNPGEVAIIQQRTRKKGTERAFFPFLP